MSKFKTAEVQNIIFMIQLLYSKAYFGGVIMRSQGLSDGSYDAEEVYDVFSDWAYGGDIFNYEGQVKGIYEGNMIHFLDAITPWEEEFNAVFEMAFDQFALGYEGV